MGRIRVLSAIAAGGAIGSMARYGLAVAELLPHRPLVRPFLGVGVLGGFTTFSTYALDIQRMVDAGATAAALVYLAGTAVAALSAAYAGSRVMRLALAAGRSPSLVNPLEVAPAEGEP